MQFVNLRDAVRQLKRCSLEMSQVPERKEGWSRTASCKAEKADSESHSGIFNGTDGLLCDHGCTKVQWNGRAPVRWRAYESSKIYVRFWTSSGMASIEANFSEPTFLGWNVGIDAKFDAFGHRRDGPPHGGIAGWRGFRVPVWREEAHSSRLKDQHSAVAG